MFTEFKFSYSDDSKSWDLLASQRNISEEMYFSDEISGFTELHTENGIKYVFVCNVFMVIFNQEIIEFLHFFGGYDFQYDFQVMASPSSFDFKCCNLKMNYTFVTTPDKFNVFYNSLEAPDLDKKSIKSA
jgi:hypothetical protein